MEGEGEREEGKRGNYPPGFSLKNHSHHGRDGHGWAWFFTRLSLSLDFSCAIIRARVCKSEKRRGTRLGRRIKISQTQAKFHPSASWTLYILCTISPSPVVLHYQACNRVN